MVEAGLGRAQNAGAERRTRVLRVTSKLSTTEKDQVRSVYLGASLGLTVFTWRFLADAVGVSQEASCATGMR